MPTIHTVLTERVHRALRTEIARQDTNWAELLTQLADLTAVLHDHGDVYAYRSLDTADEAPEAAMVAVPAVPGIDLFVRALRYATRRIGRDKAAYLAVKAIEADRCDDYDLWEAESVHRETYGDDDLLDARLDFDSFIMDNGLDTSVVTLDSIVAHVADWYVTDERAIPESLILGIHSLKVTAAEEAAVEYKTLVANPFEKSLATKLIREAV